MSATDQMAMSIDEHVDGRTLRRTRNRTAVIDALLDIVREGNLHPGAAEIADRAGVSHRSIFRYFEDLDDLARTAITHAFDDAGPLAEIPEIGIGPLDERIARYVERRIALFDRVDGTMQLARMRASTIPSIDEGIAEIAEVFRQQIAEHFAPELATFDDAARPLILDSILVLNSYESYSIHLRWLHSSSDHIRAAWTTALDVILR
jgi:TetR/AcrR family transcriptional regulator of autoinduction and epiphytic fitness